MRLKKDILGRPNGIGLHRGNSLVKKMTQIIEAVLRMHPRQLT
jgi:hypothetical protein